MAISNAVPASPETYANVINAAAWRRPPLIRNRALRWTLGAGASIYLTLALASLDVNWLRVYAGLEHGWRFIQGFLRPQVGEVRMPIARSTDKLIWRHRASRRQFALWTGWLALVALFVWCWKVMTKDTIWSFAFDAPRQAADIGERMIPPAFGYFWELIGPPRS